MPLYLGHRMGDDGKGGDDAEKYEKYDSQSGNILTDYIKQSKGKYKNSNKTDHGGSIWNVIEDKGGGHAAPDHDPMPSSPQNLKDNNVELLE